MCPRRPGNSSADLPRELLDLYGVIDEVSLPDVGDGYFVHAAESVLVEHGDEQPTRVTGSVTDEIVVFASDGGVPSSR